MTQLLMIGCLLNGETNINKGTIKLIGWYMNQLDPIEFDRVIEVLNY